MHSLLFNNNSQRREENKLVKDSDEKRFKDLQQEATQQLQDMESFTQQKTKLKMDLTTLTATKNKHKRMSKQQKERSQDLVQQNKELATKPGVQDDQEIATLQNKLQQQMKLKNKVDAKCE